jgi:hypothetical protein
MTAVLLRLAGRDPLRNHAGLDQPYRQARQTAHGAAGKGRPVVAAQGRGQAIIAKGARQVRPDILQIGPAQRLTNEQESVRYFV